MSDYLLRLLQVERSVCHSHRRQEVPKAYLGYRRLLHPLVERLECPLPLLQVA
jgi:hypothetical protein